MQDVYDLVVVGGRTIGANVAARFAEQDYNVLLLERNQVVGTPLACSGHYSRDLWTYVPPGVKRFVQNTIRGARFHVGQRTARFHKQHTVSWVVDRQAMDQYLFDHARDAGADAATGTALRDWTHTGDGLKLVLQQDGEERMVHTSMVAGCDGAASTVRRLAGLPSPRKLFVGMMAFTDEDDSDDFVDVHLNVPGFFGWRIPRGDSVEYGVAVEQGREVKPFFERHMDLTAPYTPEQVHGATIPMHPPARVTGDRCFLVGDAAGHTKPFTGGGIVYGLRAGSAAAEHIDPADPATLPAYEAAWRGELTWDIRLGEVLRKCYDLPSVLQWPALKLLSGDITGIHMDKPTTLFRREAG